MKAVMSDRLYLTGLDSRTRSEVFDLFSIPNPEYQAVARYSPWGTRFTKVPDRLYGGEPFGEDGLALPRAVQFDGEKLSGETLAQLERVTVADDRVTVGCDFPDPVVALNPMQEALERKYAKGTASEVFPGYLVVTGTSSGKTIGLLNMARLTGQRTLVLVHRNIIKNTAWVADTHKFYGGKADVGIVQGKQCRIGEHYTIAMAQTLVRWDRERLDDFFREFGTVIQDEAHICPMPFIRGLLNACPAMYRIGGTATPTRPQQMHYFLYWIIGKPWFSNSAVQAANQLPISEVRIVYTRFAYSPPEDKPFDGHEMMRLLTDNRARNEQIVKAVEQDLHDGHAVLVATSRVEHCMVLASMLKKHNPAVLEGSRHQGRKQFDQDVERVQQRQCTLVIATEQLIREGANLNPLDRLHIAMPMGTKGNVVQLCGRICRQHPRKKDAKVTVYVDGATPALRRRITGPMMSAFRQMGIANAKYLFLA